MRSIASRVPSPSSERVTEPSTATYRYRPLVPGSTTDNVARPSARKRWALADVAPMHMSTVPPGVYEYQIGASNGPLPTRLTEMLPRRASSRNSSRSSSLIVLMVGPFALGRSMAHPARSHLFVRGEPEHTCGRACRRQDRGDRWSSVRSGRRRPRLRRGAR